MNPCNCTPGWSWLKLIPKLVRSISIVPTGSARHGPKQLLHVRGRLMVVMVDHVSFINCTQAKFIVIKLIEIAW